MYSTCVHVLRQPQRLRQVLNLSPIFNNTYLTEDTDCTQHSLLLKQAVTPELG